jgi:hypothetical protein
MATDFKKLRDNARAAKTLYNTNRRDGDKELTHYIAPEIGRFDDDDDQTPNKKKKKFMKVINHTAGVAVDKLAAAYLALASPPAQDWMRVTPKNKDLMEVAGVAAYMDAVNKIIEKHFHDTNAYNRFASVYRELVVIGTGCLFIDSDPVNVSSYHAFTIGTYYFKVDSKGLPNKFYRFYKETVDNVVEAFGEENVSHRVKLKMEKEGSSYVNLIQIIETNKGRDSSKLDNKNMPYVSVYMEEDWVEGERVLRESGYEEFPVVIPRYDVVGDDSWGQSPCNRVLGPTKELQEVKSDYMSASERTIAPTVALDSRLKGQKLGANSAIYYSAQEGAPIAQAVYQINYDFGSNLALQEQVKQEINSILKSDIVAAISNIDRTGMTAYEVSQRVAEAFQGQVAFVTRVETEMLKPIAEREYNLLNRAGRFPEPPEELDGEELDVIFVSPLSQAQQATGITNIEQIIDVALRLEPLDPEMVRRKFNAPQTLDEVLKLNGAPSKLLRSDEEVAAMAAADAEAQAAQQNAERLAQMATSAEQLGNTPMNTGSALDNVMEGIQ